MHIEYLICFLLCTCLITFNSKEGGQRERYPPDTTFQFTTTDDNVSVETEVKEEIYIEEEEEKEQLSCDICENKFKSLANLTRHDQRFHLRQGTVNEFKCDFCNETFADKIMLCDHIANIQKKCTLCAKMFPTTASLETHVLAVHKRRKSQD